MGSGAEGERGRVGLAKRLKEIHHSPGQGFFETLSFRACSTTLLISNVVPKAFRARVKQYPLSLLPQRH